MGPWAGRTNFGRGTGSRSRSVTALASVQTAESNQSAGTAGMSVIYRTCQRKARL